MTNSEFLGMLIAGLATLASFFAILLKCIKPIQDLNINIVKLTAEISRLVDNDIKQDSRLSEHGKQIDILNTTKENHEQRIKALENHLE